MAIYRFEDRTPDIDATAYVAEHAVVIGDVTLERDTSVWDGAVLRGDNEPIMVKAGSNIQEGAVLHTDPGFPLTIGAGVTVGHQAMLHGCTIGDGALIGIQAVVLNGAKIGKNCLVGAGAIVTEGKEFPDNALILGAPAKVVRMLDDAGAQRLARTTAGYVDKAQRFKTGLVRIDTPDNPSTKDTL